jgi:uracil-DNA glycosylase
VIAITLERPDDVAGWWQEAARLIAAGVAPERLVWSIAGEAADLFAGGEDAAPVAEEGDAAGRRLPSLDALTDDLLLHADPARFALAYQLRWRLIQQPRLLSIASDQDVSRAVAMAKAVRRDRHKMKAFVRFRALRTKDGEIMAAWFEPEHHILAATAPFFVRRFATMRFAIVTPTASVAWDGQTLAHGPGGARGDAPAEDAMEERWLAYYTAIFNPARLKTKAMKAEMPVKYWRNLPEAKLIVPLIRDAAERVRRMEARPATPARMSCGTESKGLMPADIPNDAALASTTELKALVDACRRCPIHAHSTQGVPGEGRPQADIMFVGEQPGDQEDLAGRPFVGPAGELFDTALERVGIDRSRAYVTNAVKHFKFEPRGKRRLHKKPNASEIDACRVFLEKEIALVRPKLIVALGATAAFSVTGAQLPVQQNRGVLIAGQDWPANPRRPGALPPDEPRPDLLMTVHPSFLLRLTEQEDKRREWHAFLADLRIAADRIAFVAGKIDKRKQVAEDANITAD